MGRNQTRGPGRGGIPSPGVFGKAEGPELERVGEVLDRVLTEVLAMVVCVWCGEKLVWDKERHIYTHPGGSFYVQRCVKCGRRFDVYPHLDRCPDCGGRLVDDHCAVPTTGGR